MSGIIYRAPLEHIKSFVYGEWEGLATITVLGDFDGYRYFHVGEGVPLPTSEDAQFEPSEMTRELSEVLRGQFLKTDEYLLPVVPISCSPAQGLVALFVKKGITEDQVLAAIDGIADTAQRYSAKVAYTKATVWERNSASMGLIAALLELTEADLDELFIFAATVEV